MKFFNLTQHNYTAEQIAEIEAMGFEVVETTAEIRQMITFSGIPTRQELIARAKSLAELCEQGSTAMIGGMPCFQSHLERELLNAGVRPAYAFSERKAEESVKENGEVVKTMVFKHQGFYYVDEI